MRARVVVVSAVLAAALAACGEKKESAKAPETAPAKAPPSTAAAPEKPSAPTPPAAPAKEDPWASHKGDIPFVMGMKDGLARAAAEKKMVFIYYTSST